MKFVRDGIDPDVAQFMLSDGEDGVSTEQEDYPVLIERSRPPLPTPVHSSAGMLSARMGMIDRESSRREMRIPIHSNSEGWRRSTVIKKICITGVVVAALCCLASTINRNMGSSSKSNRRKYVAGSHPGFVNYVGGKVAASIANHPPLCDPDIVRMACEVMNNETLEFYGSSVEADLDFVHAAEISETLTVNKGSVHEMFEKLYLEDFDHLNPGAFAVSCQELCEKLVESFPALVVPRVSDVGGYWHPPSLEKGIKFSPVFDVDLSPEVLSKIIFPDIASALEPKKYIENAAMKQASPDNSATNMVDKALNARGDATSRAQAELLQELQYPKTDFLPLRVRVLNLFRIWPSIDAKVQGNKGVDYFFAPPEPGSSTPHLDPRQIKRKVVNFTKALKKNFTTFQKNISRFAKKASNTIGSFVSGAAQNASKFVSSEAKNVSRFVSKGAANVSRFVSKKAKNASHVLGKDVANFFRKNVSNFISKEGKNVAHSISQGGATGSQFIAQQGQNASQFLKMNATAFLQPQRKLTLASRNRKLTGAYSDSCQYSRDGECDDPAYCPQGTDCTDCGNCGSPPIAHTPTSGDVPDWKTKTLRIAVKARAVLNQAITKTASRKISSVVTKWYGNNQEDPTRLEVKRLMNGVKAMLDNVEFVYPGRECTAKNFAYVYPNAPHNTDPFGKFVFFLCDYFMNVSESEQIETLLHEGSRHEAARTDNSVWQGQTMYGRPLCLQVAQQCALGDAVACDKARKNADNFCYFVNDAVATPAFVEPAGRRRRATFTTDAPTAAFSADCGFFCRVQHVFTGR